MADLSRNQAKALSALIAHKTKAEAAQACGLTERTLSRYLNDETFRAALARAESELLDQAGRRLLLLQDEAVATFEDVFRRGGELAGLALGDFFREVEVSDPKTGATYDRLILDAEKVQELGQLVKKIKVDGDDFEIESYNAQTGDRLRLDAAKGVFDYVFKLRELLNVEERLAELERAVYDNQGN